MILNSSNIALLNTDILARVPIQQLLICRELVESTLALLDPSIKKQGTRFPDDPTKRELQIFQDLRNSLASQVKGKGTKTAVTQFVNKGVTGSPGDYSFKTSEVKKLEGALSTLYGPAVAKDVSKNIQSIVETQWKATRQVMADSLKQYNRAIKSGMTKIDKAVINVLNNQNNFFISGMPDKLLIGQINQIVADHVKSGLVRSALDKSIRDTLIEKMPIRSDVYYRILANDVLNRSRQFAQVNAYVEARVRRYEIFAVLDERTTEICEHMDGMIFDVEIARKIVKDITQAGIPGTDAETNAFKALRPWVYFDQMKASEGRDALYIKNAKGNPVYLPDSRFGKDGKSLGTKDERASRDVQDLASGDMNAPVLPPYHANCRTTTVVNEDDIKTQEWTENIASNNIAIGQPYLDPGTGTKSTIKNIRADKDGNLRIMTDDVAVSGKETTGILTPTRLLIDKIPAIIPSNIPETGTLELVKVAAETKGAKQIINTEVDRLLNGKSIRFIDKKGNISPLAGKDLERITNILRKKVPSVALKGLNNITLYEETIPDAGSKAVGFYINKSISLARKSPVDGRTISWNDIKITLSHEVAHHTHGGCLHEIRTLPKGIWKKWRDYDAKIRSTKGAFVSNYAKTNVDEHFAESFGYFYADPEMLRYKAPGTLKWFKQNLSKIEGWEKPRAK